LFSLTVAVSLCISNFLKRLNCVQQIDFLLFAILLSDLFALVAFFVIDYVIQPLVVVKDSSVGFTKEFGRVFIRFGLCHMPSSPPVIFCQTPQVLSLPQ